MARTADELLVQVLRFVPPEFRALASLLAARMAQLGAGEQAGEDLVEAGRLGSAEDIWLTVLARSFGAERGTDESDDALRARARRPADRLTPKAVLDATNAALARYGSGDAILIEHFSAGIFMDQDAYADNSEMFDQHLGFTLRVPLLGELPGVGGYADHDFVDVDAWAGSGGAPHPVYAEILAAVEVLRAAGTRWWLLVDPDL